MKKISFTIVIPVHNGMPFIKDCIESALNQDYSDYNIIILENMSDDGTSDYLDTLNSDKITIIKSSEFLSMEDNWARIKDLDMSEYMTILMADDKLESNYLSSITEMIEKHQHCNIYRTNINLMNENSEVFHSSDIKEKITIYDYLEGRLKHTYTETAAGYCIKTSRYKEIGGITCKFRLMHTDDKLFMEAIGENNYMAVSPCHSANYRCHSGSESGSPNAEAEISGFNLWLNWIYNLNDKKLRQIVTSHLPYHLTQIERFFSKDVMLEHKKIYSLYHANINVCLATDENYIKYMAAAITSVLESSKENDVLHFYILCNNISETSKNLIKRLKNIKDFEITFIDVDIKDYESFPAGGPHISNTTYFRYKIAELLPDVSKIIYLDCDMIVKQSLADLFETNLTGYWLGGVEDVGYYYWKNYNSEFIYKDGFYINAGMLLINISEWRQNNLFKKLVDFTVREAQNIAIGDQDVINRVCLNKIKPLDYKWNVQDSFYRAEPERKNNPNCQKIIEATENPAIIHYTNVRKPWNDFSMIKADEWWLYYIKTPFCSNNEKLIYNLYRNLSSQIEKIKEDINTLTIQVNTLTNQVNILKNKSSVFSNVLQWIFSLKNTPNKKHKIVTFMGIKLKIKRGR